MNFHTYFLHFLSGLGSVPYRRSAQNAVERLVEFHKIGREARPFLLDNNQITFTRVGSIRITFCRELKACRVKLYYILQGI